MSLLFSSLLSLVIGTVVGLTQSRIKRLYAFSTISHVGFILLALSIHTVESTQAFIFYIMQYSISNLNAFMLIIAMGYFVHTLHYNVKHSNANLQEKNNSPIQLIDQLKGYFNINPILALSLAITLFSFAGIPPLLGFFGKQMILSAAIDNGYIFMSLVAVLTSVISAVYYLAVIKQMFFDDPYYKRPVITKKQGFQVNNYNNSNYVHNYMFRRSFVKLSSHLSLVISIITLIITLFIIMPQE